MMPLKSGLLHASAVPSVVFTAPVLFLDVSLYSSGGQRQVKIMANRLDPEQGVQTQIDYLVHHQKFRVAGVDYTLRLARSGPFMGSAGDDFIVGLEGHNRIFASAGHDYVKSFSGHDSMWGGLGHDTLMGGAGHDVLDGEAGNDWLFGEQGHDVLKSLSGSDWLSGGAGDDLLLLGCAPSDARPQGVTTLQGGQGSDVYQFDFSNGLAMSGRHFQIDDQDGRNIIQLVHLDRRLCDVVMVVNAHQHSTLITVAHKGQAAGFSLEISPRSHASVSFNM